MGKDFRAAYVPGVTNTGAGQYIAIVDVGGPYYSNDVYMYETNAGLSTNIVVTNIFCTLTANWTNALTAGTVNDGEEVLDIDMAMSMAPGATIMNYEGEAHDVFNRIAQDNKAKQMTLSYGFGIDRDHHPDFPAIHGAGPGVEPGLGRRRRGPGRRHRPDRQSLRHDCRRDGLTTSGAGGPWSRRPPGMENGGSGGGISGYGIPNWQQGVGNSTESGFSPSIEIIQT